MDDVTRFGRNHDYSLQYLNTLVSPSNSDFGNISLVQEQRELEHRRRSKSIRRGGLGHQKTRSLAESSRTSSLAPPMAADSNTDPASPENDAAKLIQRTYRGYRTRRELAGVGLSASTRWVTAVKDAQWMELTRPVRESGPASEGERPVTSTSSKGESSGAAKGHWRKATAVVRRAGNEIDSASISSGSSSSSFSSSGEDQAAKAARRKKQAGKGDGSEKKMSRMMALQYFLEMVDHKHRYGTNLTTYHEVWKSSDTHDNFFHWLDHGDGKHVDMAACPRDRLERERVRYLSVEERQYYLVQVDSEGRLYWAKNGQRIDTTTEYRDSMVGIVPQDDPAPSFRPETQDGDAVAAHGSDADSSAGSTAEADRAAKYSTLEFDNAKGAKKLSHLSATTITNRLLRKTVRKNTWIFVSDTRFRLYVGIKDSGSFQHSSFLQGSRIASAGLIRIADGRLRALSPLSGHYRPPAANFRAFVKSLKEAGVDMGRVSISKSYMILAGLEMYTKGTEKSKSVVQRLVRRRETDVDPEAAAVKKKGETERNKSENAKQGKEVLAAENQMAGLQVAEKVPKQSV